VAIVKFGPVTALVSGRVGGIVFAHGKANATLKLAGRKVTKHSQAAAMARARFEICRTNWDRLSTAFQEKYATAAQSAWWTNRLGQRYHPTKYQLAMKQAATYLYSGFSPGLWPPYLGTMVPVSINSMAFAEGGPYNLNILPSMGQSVAFIILSGARSCSTTRAAKRNPKYIGAFFVISGVNKDVQPQWDAALGGLQTDERFSVSIENVGSGYYVSPPTVADGTTT